MSMSRSLAHVVLLGLLAAAGTMSALPAAENTVKLYNLTDLLVAVTDFPGPALGSTTRTDDPEPQSELIDVPSFIRQQFAEAVAQELLRGTTVRDEHRGTWFLQASPALHTHVDHVLRQLREQRSRTMRIQVRFIEMQVQHWHERYRRLRLTWQRDEKVCDRPFCDLSDDAATMLLQQFVDDEETQIVLAPELTTFAGQRANASFLRQFAYIHPNSLGPDIDDPVIEVANVGDVLDVRADWHGHGIVGLDLSFERCRLEEVNTRKIMLADDKEFPVESPQLVTNSLRYDGVLSVGEQVLIWHGLDQGLQSDAVLLALIAVEVIQAPTLAPPARTPTRQPVPSSEPDVPEQTEKGLQAEEF